MTPDLYLLETVFLGIDDMIIRKRGCLKRAASSQFGYICKDVKIIGVTH